MTDTSKTKVTSPAKRANSASRSRAADRALQPGNDIRPKGQDKPGSISREYPSIQNRVRVLLVHIPKLSIRGQARLAAEVGVSRSTISRLVNGHINPSYRLARGVTSALERQLGRALDMRDVFTTDGTYPTPSGCGLCQCKGCLPDQAYDPEGNLRSEWQGQRPGDWSLTPPAINLDAAGRKESR